MTLNDSSPVQTNNGAGSLQSESKLVLGAAAIFVYFVL